jgi:hypothetical protein
VPSFYCLPLNSVILSGVTHGIIVSHVVEGPAVVCCTFVILCVAKNPRIDSKRQDSSLRQTTSIRINQRGHPAKDALFLLPLKTVILSEVTHGITVSHAVEGPAVVCCTFVIP